jgi:hypothetical protein
LYALPLKRNNDARRLENKEPVCSIDFTIGCDCKMAFNRPPSAGFNLQRTGSIPSNSTGPTSPAYSQDFSAIFGSEVGCFGE